jgi:hypothetical protein
MEPEPDRRQSPRHPAGPPVHCAIVLGCALKFEPRAVENVSTGGFRLATDLLMPVGLEGVACFTDRAGQLYCQPGFRVVYCYEQPGRGYVLGAAFHRDLTPDELERLRDGGTGGAP